MDLSSYVTQISTGVPALSVVAVATPGITALDIDTPAGLYTVLSPLVGGRVYPLHVDQDTDWPHITYALVESQALTIDGYHLATADRFVVQIRALTAASLASTLAATKAAIEAAGGALEITDELWDFDEDIGRYRANLEVVYTVPATASAALPAALLYPISVNADPTQTDNCIIQREHQRFAVVIMTADSNVTTLRTAIKTALIGYKIGSTYWPVQYIAGRPLESGGGLEIWTETYGDSFYVQEA